MATRSAVATAALALWVCRLLASERSWQSPTDVASIIEWLSKGILKIRNVETIQVAPLENAAEAGTLEGVLLH